MMRTFFWGYFSLKWRRLFRTITILILSFFSIILLLSPTDSSDFEGASICILLTLIIIPLLSYLIEPFVIKNKEVEVIDQKETTLTKVFNEINVLITPTKQDEVLTDEIISESSSISNEQFLQTHNDSIKLKPISFSPTNLVDNREADDKKSFPALDNNIISDTTNRPSIRRFFKFDNEYLSGINFLIRFLIVFIIYLLIYFLVILNVAKNYMTRGDIDYDGRDTSMYFFILTTICILFLFIPLIPTLFKRSRALGFSKMGSIVITLYFVILPTITILLVGTDLQSREVLIGMINLPILFLIFVDGKKGTNSMSN